MAASHSVDRVKHAPLVYTNLPTRAVTGPFWTGDIDDWRIAPLEYDAVHLHSDDLEDARWPVTVEMEVPMDACPGVIALEVSTTAGRDVIPLLVRSKVDSPSTPALFLAPTLTWLAYALEHSPAEVPAKCRETAFEFGRDNALNSLYDRHLDGSGVSLASTRRPLLGMRHDHKFRASGFEHTMSADLQIVGWLMRQDVEFDIAADHDLHDEGSELLDRHRVIVTGSHPEYWTTPMRSALSTWLDRGGRMMYLGGNGFYWVTAIDPERPHVVELRRDMNGIRTWAGRPGEAHMSATGEPGGLWRNRGASESALSGVRTRTMGFSSSAPYRRTEASHDPRVARIFEGVESDAVIGDQGLVMGGAAGYETDAADYFDGTPAHALVIASCTELPADYLLDSDGSMTEEHPDERPRARADMVFFETRCGGAVFSVGSVTWGGSLPIDGDKNHVSRITANVLKWFTQRSLSGRDDATD
ncbi:N,N-dimethylformamidase beta subunit family domain-containing protein [Rhodococcus qingshengii]|uniref:N,N-dimethylformamidase beta subunit family domain-containing protein n=1 Tax=Rhodococcus qingshengii TaxID=334542 RepID=UPI0036D7CC9E